MSDDRKWVDLNPMLDLLSSIDNSLKRLLEYAETSQKNQEKMMAFSENAVQEQMERLAEQDKFRKSMGLEHLSEQLMKMAGPLTEELQSHMRDKEEFYRKIGKSSGKEKIPIEDQTVDDIVKSGPKDEDKEDVA